MATWTNMAVSIYSPELIGVLSSARRKYINARPGTKLEFYFGNLMFFLQYLPARYFDHTN